MAGDAPAARSHPDDQCWIEANWPETTDDLVCRHCRRKSDNLIPLGYGTRPRIRVHIECSDPYRAEIKRRAVVASGIRAA
jgi:hypothetical protein